MKNSASLAVWNVNENDFPKNGEMDKKLKFLIRYAILAPSGHNSQPWRFLINNSSIEIWPEYERRRSAVDPDDRELYISLGCATKNLEVAANYFGMMFEKKYQIDNKKGLGVISFKFKDGKRNGDKNELFGAITRRLTNRGEYEIKPVDRDLRVNEFEGVDIKFFGNKDIKEDISQLIYDSNRVWYKSKKLIEELDYWLQDDVLNGSDGVPTGALNLYKLAANFKYLLSKDPEIAIKKAEKERKLAWEAPMLAVVATKMDGIKHWIMAGEIYEEMALKLTNYGLAHAFFNTVVELRTQREKMAKLLEIKGRPQMFIRIGYAKETGVHSKRRTIEEVIVNS